MTDEPLPAIEPCPWCHGADLSIPVRKRTSVTCENCGAEGPVADKPTLAIAAWNRRPAGSAREATLEHALEKIGAWAKAYPIAVFPEPDLKRAHEVLSAAGISLDAISASNMRHVITQVQELVERALRGPGGGE